MYNVSKYNQWIKHNLQNKLISSEYSSVNTIYNYNT